jgi:hypothetical protein
MHFPLMMFSSQRCQCQNPAMTAEEYSERYKELKETSAIATVPMRQIEKLIEINACIYAIRVLATISWQMLQNSIMT